MTLADRLYETGEESGMPPLSLEWYTYYAKNILGTTGLFIPDVTKHEPGLYDEQEGIISFDHTTLGCVCGWRTDGDESYFDHIK